MPIRLSDLRLPIDAPETALLDAACAKGRLKKNAVKELRILRRSLDRRRRQAIYSFSVELVLHGEAVAVEDLPWSPDIRSGDARLEHRPIVVGTGPAGLFAAWLLARQGYRPLVLERGTRMNERVRSIKRLNEEGVLEGESNYLFGEGGAGTFSDGKLTTRSKDPRAAFVLHAFRERTGVDQVLWDYRPHLGSDRIRRVVGRMRGEIEALGGEILYGCPFLGVFAEGGRLRAARVSEGEIPAELIILATGHSVRPLYRSLFASGVAMSAKPFQLGFRVEHPQDFVDLRIYGKKERDPRLGPADYRLSVKLEESTVYSFCMCPGGEIIPAVSDVGHMNTNGMSWSSKATGFANSGLVTTLEPSDFGGDGHPLFGLDLQERFEARAAELVGHSLAIPAQRLLDWKAGRLSDSLPPSSCRSGLVSANLAEVVPPLVQERLLRAIAGFEHQMPGFLQADALLVGPECRSSSPVRIERDPTTFESPSLAGLYPVGEGAGFAGGIISAAIDGLRAAEAICRRYAKPS